MNLRDLNHEQYGLLFDVQRSMRYHDRRRAFFDRLHQITGGLTVLLAGSVLFDIARPGATPWWLSSLAVAAALLVAWDMVVNYAAKAGLHRELRRRFGVLEMAMLSGDLEDGTWQEHHLERLRIEQDEPPVYRALDLLCRNELLRAEGISNPAHRARVSGWQKATRHLLHWADLSAR